MVVKTRRFPTVFAVVLSVADFFGPGSDAVSQNMIFTGEPLGTFQGQHVGDADTVVRRPEAANPTLASPDTVPIEIVALSLISVEPIVVTYNNGQNPEDWDIGVGLSNEAPSQGQITIEQTSDNRGIFDSQIQVVPSLGLRALPAERSGP